MNSWPKPFTVYILRCADNSLYTGQTTNLDKRIELHNRGAGARYTRGRGPVELVYRTEVATLKEAFLLEHKIKRMPRARKERLIDGARRRTRHQPTGTKSKSKPRGAPTTKSREDRSGVPTAAGEQAVAD